MSRHSSQSAHREANRPLTKVELGHRIRALRERLDMTQANLGHKIGKSDTEVNRWENARVEPNYDTRVKLAGALGVNVLELIEVAPSSSSNGNGMDLLGELPAAPYGADPGSDIEAVWMEELRRIGASDASAQQKMLDRDSLSTAIASIAWARAETAQIERARAITAINHAGQARAEAAGGQREFLETPIEPRPEKVQKRKAAS